MSFIVPEDEPLFKPTATKQISRRDRLEKILEGDFGPTCYHFNHGFFWNAQLWPRNSPYDYWSRLDSASRKEGFKLPPDARAYIEWLLRDDLKDVE